MTFIPEWAEKELQFKSKYTPEQIAEAKGPITRPVIDLADAEKTIGELCNRAGIAKSAEEVMIHGHKKRGRPRKEKK